MPTPKRLYPLTRREPVSETPCDRAFSVALKSHETSWERVRSASATCLYSVGHQMLSACQHFDLSDGDLQAFRSTLTQGLTARDFALISRAVRQFVSSIDRTKINFADTDSAEAAFVHAAITYQDALDAWSRDDHKDAHPLTVMARSSLNRLGD